jgi:transposase
MSRVEVSARTKRRRSYTDEQRAELLAEAARPGAVVAQVARRYGMADSLIYDWRKRRRCAELATAEAAVHRSVRHGGRHPSTRADPRPSHIRPPA